MSLDLKIKQLAKDYAFEVVANRRHLHTNPELSFQEYNTAKFVAQKQCPFLKPSMVVLKIVYDQQEKEEYKGELQAP